MCKLAPGQIQENQHSIGYQVPWLYSATTGVQETKPGILRQSQFVSAQVGVSMAHTGARASEVTEVLIVMLRTLAPSVTHVSHVQTNTGPATAVETRAGMNFAVTLILVTWAVINVVTAHK